MAPPAHGEAPSAANTNGADGVMVEETHLDDPMGAGEGALPDGPDRESVPGRHEDSDAASGTRAHTIPISASQLGEGLTRSSRYTIPDDLFDDDSDEDGDHDYVPRGGNALPTVGATGPKPLPIKKPTNGASQAAAPKTTETSKDAKTQKKDAKAPK